MKKYLLSIALIFFIFLEINAHVDHYSKYNYLEYELFRNNKLIGYHTYKFQRKGDDLIINNAALSLTDSTGLKYSAFP